MWLTSAVKEGPFFSTPSLAFIVYRLFDDDYCDQHEISHSGFDLHFSSNEWYSASLHVFVSHLYSFVEKYVLSSLALFDSIICLFVCFCIELLVCFGDSFFVIFFSVYYCFLPRWSLSFHLVYSFLHCAKDFKFAAAAVYYWFYFSYAVNRVIEDLVIYVRECSAYVFLLEFSSTASGLTFKSLIHFEFTFVYDVT